MKNSLYIIAGLVLVLWGLITFAFNSSIYFNLLLPFAGFIVLLQIFFAKRMAKTQKNKN